MSTEHQQYSTENQHAVIQRYADEHGLIIARDRGKILKGDGGGVVCKIRREGLLRRAGA